MEQNAPQEISLLSKKLAAFPTKFLLPLEVAIMISPGCKNCLGDILSFRIQTNSS